MFYIIFIAVFVVGYLAFMKFYYPKIKGGSMQATEESNKEWAEKKDEITSEYLTNPNKFGLISEVADGGKVLGIISAMIPKNLKSKLLSGLKDTVTFTQTVDMAHYYLVATDQGLHYTGFDGEKCFINEVYDYTHIQNQQMSSNQFTFDYKGEKVTFQPDKDIQQFLPGGYPRFIIHEKEHIGSSRGPKNSFYREYLAYENTNNQALKMARNSFSVGLDAMKMTPEKARDIKVREYFLEEFKKKLKV